MMIKLLPSVKLPYEMTRGSMAERSAKAATLVEQLKIETEKAIKNKTINIRKLQTIIDGILPKQISIKVLKNRDNSCSALNDTISNDRWQITDLTMELDSKDGELPQELIIAVLHEGRHIADSLFNPKYLARQQTLEQKSLYMGKYNNVYGNQLYISEYAETPKEIKETMKIIKHKLHNLLRGYSPADKVNIIQDLRYGLETERNAYIMQYKYGQEFYKKGIVNREDYYEDHTPKFLFEEKFALLKQTAFEIIQKARRENANQLKQKRLKNSRTA